MRTACYLVCILTGTIIGGRGRSSVLRFILGGSSMGRVPSIENTAAECDFPNFSRFSVYPTSL